MTAHPKRAGLALAIAAAGALCASDALAQDPFDFLFGGFGGGGRARRESAGPRPEAAPAKKRDSAKKAQEKRRDSAGPGTPAATAARSGPEAPPPPYEPQITRLSEVLGSLAFLRDLCGAGDGEEWRGKMSALLNADAPSGPRRDRLVASFNRGFHGYELTYRACTPNAETAISRYLSEAARLSRDIAYRYGNP